MRHNHVPMEQIGRYHVKRVLGSGAFATVWLGYDPGLEVPVAIKVLADNWSNNADVRERFLAEARTLRRIDDPRVVRVFDIGVLNEATNAQPYFVMDYLPGGTVAEVMGNLSIPEALAYGVAAAGAVQVLHDADVIHRDVKPSNLLLDSRIVPARLVIADLGSAKRLAEASGVTVTTGTPAYMAPEQAHQTNGFDGRADVYAVAAVTYHLLSGHTPFDDRTVVSVLHRGAAAKPRPIAVELGTPTALDRLLTRSLSWDPDVRPATAAAFGHELSQFLHVDEDAPHSHAREVPAGAVIVFCVILGVALFLITFVFLR